MAHIKPKDNPPEERFKNNLNQLGELLIDLIKEANSKGFNNIDANMAKMGVGMLQCINNHVLIRGFIEKSCRYWDSMLDKEDETEEEALDRKQRFLLQHSTIIFSDLPLDSVNSVKGLFTATDSQGEPLISIDDKEDIWAFFKALVKCSINYYIGNEGAQMLLSSKVPSTFNIKQEAIKWKIDLK
ncbi:MAG: hypothetical protein KC414_14805 [Romboutsia sp.]|nr:hypothetical protein [Romboutsia sp.]